MNQHLGPIPPRYKHLLHGGDYNPDQWTTMPEIWDEDMRLMKLAACNAVTLGIFAWSTLEPEEGRFEFGWLDTVMEKLAANRISVVMATPSGGKPAWMARKYPEIRRVNAQGVRAAQGGRHNHCRQSPVYREKCVIINSKLAERYKDHPSLILWHVSNEYSRGDCYCDLCMASFQNWLRDRYDNDLDKLNQAYWSAFWSHTYPTWEDVIPNDGSVHGLMIDWHRFKTWQTIDFFKTESAPLRQITPNIPVTTNFHTSPCNLDYWRFAKHLDVVSWDVYPAWHESKDEVEPAVLAAFHYNRARAMKGGRSWILMESVPSIPTRGKIKKRKKPGMNLLASLQAVAHGSDSVLYFQWRKGRGGLEKFHGAVVDHEGSENTREFKGVAEVGEAMKKLDAIVGTTVKAQVAVMHDWDNETAIAEGARIYLGQNNDYMKDCHAHYRPFWQVGVPVDVIDQTVELSGYKLVVVPFAYMLRPGFADRLRTYVEQGGTAVMTYWSAVVNESDLCFLGGVPGDGLRQVFGVWEEESQSYYPHESVAFTMESDNALGINGSYKGVETCSLAHAESAEVLARFTEDYFDGSPALTVNHFGKGKAYYIAARTEDQFLSDLYGKLIGELGIARAIDADLPYGVTAQLRTDGASRYVFLLNFNDQPVQVTVAQRYEDLLTGEQVAGQVALAPFGVRVLKI